MTAHVLVPLGNEVRKGLRFAWSERIQILIELPMFAAFILLLGPLLGQGWQLAAGRVSWSLDSRTTTLLVVWFVPFIFFYMQIVKLFWRLLGEIQAGTIEQVRLSALPAWLVAAAGRVVAAFAETLLVAAATYGIVAAFVHVDLHWRLSALLPTVMVVIAGVGVSLIIAGATLVWKRIQLVNDAVLTLIMLFSASAIPLIDVPGWWATASHLLPLTDPVGGLYRTLVSDRPALTAWGVGGLVPMIATSVGYLAAGIGVFTLGEHAAKRRGTLGRY
jgi:ABC-2 type transport system permease protein